MRIDTDTVENAAKIIFKNIIKFLSNYRVTAQSGHDFIPDIHQVSQKMLIRHGYVDLYYPLAIMESLSELIGSKSDEEIEDLMQGKSVDSNFDYISSLRLYEEFLDDESPGGFKGRMMKLGVEYPLNYVFEEEKNEGQK